jgi:hypothetical protein
MLFDIVIPIPINSNRIIWILNEKGKTIPVTGCEGP